MEFLVAVAFALLLGLVVGWFGGIVFTGRQVGKAVQREVREGRITRDEALRIANLPQ